MSEFFWPGRAKNVISAIDYPYLCYFGGKKIEKKFFCTDPTCINCDEEDAGGGRAVCSKLSSAPEL
jgi:hypothetical protein